jgi:hypothetical protein
MDALRLARRQNSDISATAIALRLFNDKPSSLHTKFDYTVAFAAELASIAGHRKQLF